jgi:hypothetical protein
MRYYMTLFNYHTAFKKVALSPFCRRNYSEHHKVVGWDPPCCLRGKPGFELGSSCLPGSMILNPVLYPWLHTSAGSEPMTHQSVMPQLLPAVPSFLHGSLSRVMHLFHPLNHIISLCIMPSTRFFQLLPLSLFHLRCAFLLKWPFWLWPFWWGQWRWFGWHMILKPGDTWLEYVWLWAILITVIYSQEKMQVKHLINVTNYSNNECFYSRLKIPYWNHGGQVFTNLLTFWTLGTEHICLLTNVFR